MYTIACTGHRNSKIGGYSINPTATYIYRWIAIQLIKLLQEHEQINCISGMAIGVDQIFASVVNVIKQKYPEKIRLTCALPYENHGSNWPLESQQYHQTILSLADEVKVVSEGSYAIWKLLERDRWMVDNCDLLLGVWNGDKSGGTYQTIKYAQSINKDIIFINDKKLKAFINITNKLVEIYNGK